MTDLSLPKGLQEESAEKPSDCFLPNDDLTERLRYQQLFNQIPMYYLLITQRNAIVDLFLYAEYKAFEILSESCPQSIWSTNMKVLEVL
jgi:hypothetical protein